MRSNPRVPVYIVRYSINGARFERRFTAESKCALYEGILRASGVEPTRKVIRMKKSNTTAF